MRFPFLVLGFLIGTSLLDAGDLGRTDRLWSLYLSETVRRGLPLVNDDPDPGVVPYWPTLVSARAEALSLEPRADSTLITAWVDLQEADPGSAVGPLRQGWPRPSLSLLSPRAWGETLFTAWDGISDPKDWTAAWLAWDEKAYSPPVLLRGLEVLEKTDPSAVGPLLDQALGLYPEDRRFLPLVARHPDLVPNASALLSRAGYSPVSPGAAGKDYGAWLTDPKATAPTEGLWLWDADRDGVAESRLVFASGNLQTWTRSVPGHSRWTLAFREGRPSTLTETRDGASWTLDWEAYPLARTLTYRWGDRTIAYRFRPLAQPVPLWPVERFSVPPARLPSVLAELWLPLDARALAQQAAAIEFRDGNLVTQTLFLFRGEAWMQTEDRDRDGRTDTWSYYRSGTLASVYHDAEGRGQVSLREIYRRGELDQVQKRAPSGPRAEFVLFPRAGVQLWDPHGQGRPLDRIFLWSGSDRLDALVFSGSDLPWETMPPWEPRP